MGPRPLWSRIIKYWFILPYFNDSSFWKSFVSKKVISSRFGNKIHQTWGRHFVCETWSYLWKSTRCNIFVCTLFQPPIEMSNNVAWLTDVMSHFWCSFMAINTSISSSWAMLDNFHLGPVRKYVHWTFIKKVFNEIFPARKCMRSGIFDET